MSLTFQTSADHLGEDYLHMEFTGVQKGLDYFKVSALESISSLFAELSNKNLLCVTVKSFCALTFSTWLTGVEYSARNDIFYVLSVSFSVFTVIPQ